MSNRNRWMVLSLAALLLTVAAGLAYAAASEEEAAGRSFAIAADASGDAAEGRRSQIKLVLDHAGSAERMELVNLHELEVGESRTFATERGTPVVVTRDAEGFELDLEGRKIRLADHFTAENPAGTGTSEDDGTRQFHHKIVLHEGGEGESGAANVMIVRKRAVAGEADAVIGDADAADPADADVVVVRRTGPEGHGFAFATGGGELPMLAPPVEVTIRRLEASAKFQELDAPTRAKVVEALRDSAPKAGAFVAGEPGSQVIVLELEEENAAGDSN